MKQIFDAHPTLRNTCVPSHSSGSLVCVCPTYSHDAYCSKYAMVDMDISKSVKSTPQLLSALCGGTAQIQQWTLLHCLMTFLASELVKFMSRNYLLLVAGGRVQEDVNSLITGMNENGVGSNLVNDQHHKSSALMIVKTESIQQVLDRKDAPHYIIVTIYEHPWHETDK